MSSATMESSCSPAFLYYNPEQSKQHGQFVSQPPASKKSAPTQTVIPPNSQPEREVPFPSSLWNQRPAQAKTFTIHAPTPLLATATLSPDALQKSTGLLTPSSPTLMGGPSGGDFYFYPQTPAHSNTPVSQSWSMDEGCSSTVTPLEIQLPLTPELWKERSPVSPDYQLPMQFMSNCTSPSLMLSSCPSLSPASDHSSSPDIDFCDPRQLTYPSPSTAEFDLSELPKISSSDEDHSFLSERIEIKLEDQDLESFCLGSPAPADEAPAGTINPAALFGGMKRTRDEEEEDSWDLDNEDFSDDEDSVLGELSGNSMLMPPSPPASDLSRRSSVDPPSKKVKREEIDSDDFELDSIIAEARLRGVDEEICTDDNGFLSAFSSCDGHSHHHHHQNLTPAPSDSGDSTEIAPAPVVRRGRKQSLTEDPSKTFVCHLCTRRFRRQEHLKRHFRSLHTKDKPFSCPECGKKFSRSDNLSQHARTHGSATIHMTMVDGELVSDDAPVTGGGGSLLENSPLGIVLVDAEKLADSKAKNIQRRKKKRDE